MTTAVSTTTDQQAAQHVRGSLLLVSGRVIAIVVNFAVQILTVRYLSKADYGIYAFAFTVTSVLSVISVLGMDKAASRFLPLALDQRRFGRFWGALLLMLGGAAALGALVAVGLAAFSEWAPSSVPIEPQTRVVLAVFAGLVVCNALDAVFQSLFAVLSDPTAIFVRRHVLGPLLKLGAAAIVVGLNGNVYVFAAGQLVAAGCGLALSISLLPRTFRSHGGVPRVGAQPIEFPVGEIYKFGGALLAGDLSYLMRSALAPLLLGLFFLGGVEVATYQSVAPLARLNEFVLLTFSVLFLPQAAKLSERERRSDLQTLFEGTTVWVTLLSFPIFAATFLLSAELPIWLFGGEYATSGVVLGWLAIGFFVNASFGVSLRVLRAAGQIRELLVADILLLSIAAALCFVLVRSHGAVGGAWAVCGTYVAQAAVYSALASRANLVRPVTVQSAAPFAVGVGGCVAAAFARQTLSLGPWFAIVSGGLLCCALAWLFGRQLNLCQVFPELRRLPLLGRWFDAAQQAGAVAPATPTAAGQVRVAYLMSRFPKLTETFVLNEILEMERQGFHVDVFPLRRESAALVQPDAQDVVARAHFTPLVSLRILGANLLTMLSSPVAYTSTLATLVRANWGSRRYLAGALAFFPKAVYFARRMRQLGIQHVHAHFASHPAAVAFVIKRLGGISYSFVAHGSDLHRDQHMLAEKTRDASFVVAISSYNREMILDVSGREHSEKVHVVHCGIDPSRFAPRSQPTRYERGAGPFKIVCIGTLHEVKGQRHLIDACHVLNQQGLEFECHLLGGGPDRTALQEQVDGLNLHSSVHLHGPCTSDEVLRFLQEADALAAPSVLSRDGRREGIPVVLMEAMASGVPCVASEISGIPEIIEDDVTGLLTPPGDHRALAESLVRLIRDKEVRRRLAQGGLDKVSREFCLTSNTNLVANRILELAPGEVSP